METMSTHINHLLNLNLQIITEKIFLDFLDFDSFATCLKVCKKWRHYIQLTFLQNFRTFQRIQLKRFLCFWESKPMKFNPVDLQSVLALYRTEVYTRISYINASPTDIIVVMTRHGQRKGLVIKFDSHGKLLHRSDIHLQAPLKKVITTNDFVILMTTESQPIGFDRETVKLANLDFAQAKKLQITPNGGVFNMQKKKSSPDYNDYMLRKLHPNTLVMMSYQRIQFKVPRHENCPVSKREHVITNDHVINACQHGFIELVDHSTGSTVWVKKFLSQEADEIFKILHTEPSDRLVTIFTTYMADINLFHVLIQNVKNGNLLNQITFQAHLKPSFAISPTFFTYVCNKKSVERESNLSIEIYKSSGCSGEVSVQKWNQFQVNVNTTFYSVEILRNRILLLSYLCDSGAPFNSEVRVYDLESKGFSTTLKTIGDMRFCGPLDQKFLNFMSDTKFILQHCNSDQQKLSIVTFDHDPDHTMDKIDSVF